MNIFKYLSRTVKEYIFYRRAKLLCSQSLAKNNLTAWEKQFLTSIKNKRILTQKQFNKLSEISTKSSIILRRKPRSINTHRDFFHDSGDINLCFCEKHGVSWGDVHDFDRD